MEALKLDATSLQEIRQTFQLTGSKSESNRMLLLQAFHPEIKLSNVSNADDTQLLHKALSSQEDVVDIHHAGTAMRFLTTYFAFKEDSEVVLTGSQRMQQRPIRILVKALRQLGAEIEHLANDGFPPLKITGKKPTKNEVNIDAGTSSQFVSSILLSSSYFTNGLRLNLEGTITSQPYLQMTLDLMKQIGYSIQMNESQIEIHPPKQVSVQEIAIESDWSSASYFYSLLALASEGEIELKNFRKHSLQGDAAIVSYFEELGVYTTFKDSNTIKLTKKNTEVSTLELDLNNTPDVAQTLCVTCLGLGINAYFTGLHTLKIKETDRLVALQNELEKFGAIVEITDSTLRMISPKQLSQNKTIATYNDHRMAMAFAPLAQKVALHIEDPMVVTKSFPDFWEQLSFLKT